MLLFAHIGLTLAGAQYFRRFHNFDLFFVVLGSMLPDIIDKPLAWAIYGTPAMGRIYAHTLLFLLMLSIAATVLHSERIESLSVGVLAHLILDSMWTSPVVLLWPLFGAFPLHIDQGPMGYLEMLLNALSNPVVIVPETLGFVYILYYLYIRKDTVKAIGKVGWRHWAKRLIMAELAPMPERNGPNL